jgi:hypothetical protein
VRIEAAPKIQWISLKLSAVCNIHVGLFSFSLDKEMCNGVPLVAQLGEEIPCMPEPLKPLK